MTTPNMVNMEQLSTLRMVAGNERKYNKVIVDGKVKQWVGIGWVTLDEIPDPSKYPTVVGD